MAAPKGTLWQRQAHTEGKHLVLEHYLNAWFPILGQGGWNRRIVFVDGFAGPGEYEDGEDGSPVVAMRVLAEHSAKIKAEVVFFFIEKEHARAKHLKEVVADWQPRLPENVTADVLEGLFDESMTDVLDALDEQGKQMAPAFVMIDPFGVKGLPMEVIRRILANSSCEVYVSFMWETMERFVTEPELETSLDELFGSENWRQARALTGDERKDFLHALYREKLKEAGAKEVVHFHLFAGSRLKYSIFFGTGHTKGSDRMKKAIWKVAPWGDFAFRGGSQNQLVLLGLETPDFLPLQHLLQDRFGGRGWVSIRDVLEFVRSGETIYHDSQVKTPVLKPMEKQDLLRVKDGTRKKRYTYPDGCRIKFEPRLQGTLQV